jgi:hypothetical protein
MGELALEAMPVGGVLDHAGALPDTDEPAQRGKVCRKVSGKLEHCALRSTLVSDQR